MADFEDYYEILGVDAEASPQEIERAWKDLRIILHPDRVPEASPSAKKRAEKEFKKASQAYDVLKDPQTRRDYHKEWLRKKGSTTSSAKDRAPTKPKPIIDPPGIVFKNMKPGETKQTSFLVLNVGGPYSKIHVSNPDSWLKISDWHSISTNDELPLKVNIIAQADDSGRKRSENIYVQLDDIQTYITAILEPKMRMEIRDHHWHDVGFENLNSWAQGQFISGKTEFKGTHFEYRLEPKMYRKIRDHNWHDVGFQDLNLWAQGQFNSGKVEFKGKYFEYRMNQITRKYQFLLQHKHKSAIYATVIPGKYQFRLMHKHKSAVYAP
jgi:curved DNA-binding protein CbpA